MSPFPPPFPGTAQSAPERQNRPPDRSRPQADSTFKVLQSRILANRVKSRPDFKKNRGRLSPFASLRQDFEGQVLLLQADINKR